MTFGSPRLFLDEDSLGLRAGLAARGYAIFDAKSEGLLHQADGEQLAHATALGAILVTGNRYDFEILAGGWRALHVNYPGVISFQGPPRWAPMSVQVELIDRRLREVGVTAFCNTMHIWEVARGRWRIQDGRQKPPRRR